MSRAKLTHPVSLEIPCVDTSARMPVSVATRLTEIGAHDVLFEWFTAAVLTVGARATVQDPISRTHCIPDGLKRPKKLPDNVYVDSWIS